MPTKANKTGAEEASTDEDDLFDTEGSSGSLYKMESVGDGVKGLVTNRKEGKTKLGDAVFYTVQTAEGDKVFVPTASLLEDLDKFKRQFGIGKFIVDIKLTELRKGSYPSPFKVFKTRAGLASEARLTALGIATFDEESESGAYSDEAAEKTGE